MTIKDIISVVDELAPFDTQADFDNSGFLVGDENTIVTKVLCCLDITDDVIKEAKELGCELIVSHHPVIFSPLIKVTSDSIVYKLIKNDLSALCLHTNFDRAAVFGVNQILANYLDLKNTVLYPEDFLCVGELHKPMSDKEFARFVALQLDINSVKYTQIGDNPIKKVAVSSGAGSDAVTLMDKYGFDALVTGEIKHHHFLYAKEKSLCAVEAGHFETESIAVFSMSFMLYQGLQNESVEFLVSKTEHSPTSVYYTDDPEKEKGDDLKEMEECFESLTNQ